MAERSPRISVIVPCRNYGAFLGEAIESVLSQSLPVHQIVFVDDASTDNSVEVARSFERRIELVHGRFGTCGAARNAGLERATGEYIAFLDADDAWPPHSLAARFDALRAASATICFGRVRQTWLGVDPTARQIGPEMAGRLAGSMLVARPVFADAGVFDESLQVSETIEWASRAVDAGATITACQELVLYRRVHAANMMRVTENVNRLPLKALRSIVARRAGIGAA